MSSPFALATVRSTIRRRVALFSWALAFGVFAPVVAPAAQAYPVHQVVEGESLSSIAAANGMQIARLAAANGMAWNGYVTAGQTLAIPPADGGYSGPNGETLGSATSTTPVQSAAAAQTTSSSSPATSSSTGSTSSSSSSSSSGGGHHVAPGDTLSTIAARLGTTVAALAAANGIANPNFVMAGLTLRNPGTSTATTASPAPSVVPATSSTGPEGSSAATGSGAVNTNERLSSAQIAEIGRQNGIPGDLAAAIAWQESGNNNAAVSSVGARGVMQIMPGTWDWINSSLASPPLNRASAHDNVRAGSLFLKQLLKEAGGDQSAAIAGYYQGLGSVKQRGMYDDTKQYVQSVQALRSRVG